MDIISLQYAALVIASVCIFFIIPNKLRVAYLTLISLGFIATFSYYLVAWFLVYSLVNFYIGRKIPGAKNKILVYRAGIVFNIAQLFLLRYATFAIDPVFAMFNSDILVSRLSQIIIPIGISYFTLQGIGYLINIKMGWEKPENNFIHYTLYLTFFPKFISGPIERSNHFLPQLKTDKPFDDKMVTEGIKIALFGFFKKIAIANQIAPFITITYANVHGADGSSLWILLFLQPLYLYFDFSGYTDIAIGFARMFGIQLLPNFNRPFFSENMTNFWKRFHISLSSWFNDYIFRQTSFKRRKWGIYASTYAVFVTFVLFGIWHGAGWNFMLLGLLQALAINFEFFTKNSRAKMLSILPDRGRVWFGRFMTYTFYGTSLVFFFSPDLSSTAAFFTNIFTVRNSVPAVVLTGIPYSALLFIFVYFIIELIQNDYESTYAKILAWWNSENKKNVVIRWTVYSAVIAIVFVLGSSIHQFIYAQF